MGPSDFDAMWICVDEIQIQDRIFRLIPAMKFDPPPAHGLLRMSAKPRFTFLKNNART